MAVQILEQTQYQAIKGPYEINAAPANSNKLAAKSTKTPIKAIRTPISSLMGGSIGETGNEIKVTDELVKEI